MTAFAVRMREQYRFRFLELREVENPPTSVYLINDSNPLNDCRFLQ